MTESSDIAPARKYALETWWHRLLRVLIYGSTLLLCFFFVQKAVIESSQHQRYSYSFEKDYGTVKGSEYNCTVDENSKLVLCGDLNDPDQLLIKYTSIRGSEPAKDGKGTVNEAIQELRRRGFSAFDLAKLIVEGRKIRYKAEERYNIQELMSGLGMALLIGGAWYLTALLVYKIILYVVYGHTKVKKST
jgi:hypothetical protein